MGPKDFHDSRMKLFDFNDFVELAVNLIKLNDSAFKNPQHLSEAEKIVQIIQRSIVKLANCKNGYEVNDYYFIEDIFNSYSDQQKKNVKVLIQPIKVEIIRVLENLDIDIDEMRGVVKKRDHEIKAHRNFMNRGGHISFNLNYLHNYLEKVGEKEYTLGKILVSIEQLSDN